MGVTKGLTCLLVLGAMAVCVAQTPAHGVQEFTKSGTFVVPSAVSSMTVELWGGGGGGGGGAVGGIGPGSGGGGGGSGAYARTVLAVEPGQRYDIEVGRGGAGGSGEGGRPFAAGDHGSDSFVRLNGTVVLLARGGRGGNGGLFIEGGENGTRGGDGFVIVSW